MERTSQVLQHENPKICFSFEKIKIILYLCWVAKLNPAVSICPTVQSDTWMKIKVFILQHGDPKNLLLLKKHA